MVSNAPDVCDIDRVHVFVFTVYDLLRYTYVYTWFITIQYVGMVVMIVRSISVI